MFEAVQLPSSSMPPGLGALWKESLGDPEVCVAVLDGPVDLSHPCFHGANLQRVATLVNDPAGSGRMSTHGTHVASVIFGQPGGPIAGIAPRCRGLVLSVFRDEQEVPLSQLDLARAIDLALQEGAHIVNISGGELSPKGQADPILQRIIRRCAESHVLVVAAAGNDGCECLHVPAALPSVLAVGALAETGEPLESSNWGKSYRSQGVLAPGENILGAAPGGRTTRLTGSSFATPIVSGVAALLLSIKRQRGEKFDPLAVGEILLNSAVPCQPRDSPECRRYLAGILDIPRALALALKGERKTMSSLDASAVTAPAAGVPAVPAAGNAVISSEAGVRPAGIEPSCTPPVPPPSPQPAAAPSSVVASQQPAPAPSSVVASGQTAPSTGGCGCGGGKKSNIFALGTISFDFGTEARRDSFRQLMPYTKDGYPPNPFAVDQLVPYLDNNKSESTKLIWTLNLDATPIYAIEAELAYADDVYSLLRQALRNEALKQTDDNYVGRVSVPGVLTSRTVRLFSGQVIPVVITMPRGLYAWNEQAIIAQVKKTLPNPDGTVDIYLRNFLNKVYYEFRNLGQNPQDRALNYSATNMFQLASSLPAVINPTSLIPNIAAGTLYAFDTISVSKSPYCRMDSDCWDVQLTFFDPTNDQSANIVLQYTVDVSDTMPVTLGPARMWTSSPL